jgi:DNA polymerase-3 subunit delta'
MSFAAILGQERALGFLRRMVDRGRVPGALLFLGPHQVGKRTAALTLAKALNCEREGATGWDSCDTCPSCRKVDAGVHPDVISVAPDGQFIKIGQVREITEQLGLNPLLARRRMVVLRESERMNPDAANAFLKTLEEPPADTLIVLCAEDTSRLLPTIVSRCVPVRFNPLPEEVLRRLLAAQPGGAAPQGDGLDFAVRLAQGRLRPELATRLPAWLEIRDELLRAFRNPDGALGAGLGEKFAKWSASGDWGFVLEWLETWFRDVALLAAGGQEGRLINADRADDVRALAPRMTAESAAHGFAAVLGTRDALARNANKHLALEALWLTLCQEGLALPGGSA